MNRYEQELLNNCSNLDAVTNAGGKITNCAQAIIDNKKEASKRLCRFIEKSVELKNPQITSIAIATKDSLIKFDHLHLYIFEQFRIFHHKHLTNLLS